MLRLQGWNKIKHAQFSIQVQDYKALADKMKSMTPEQQKAYAMQMAQQMQSANHTTKPPAENPEAAKLVASNQTIVYQLRQLSDEFGAKVRAIKEKEAAERDAVKTTGLYQVARRPIKRAYRHVVV